MKFRPISLLTAALFFGLTACSDSTGSDENPNDPNNPNAENPGAELPGPAVELPTLETCNSTATDEQNNAASTALASASATGGQKLIDFLLTLDRGSLNAQTTGLSLNSTDYQKALTDVPGHCPAIAGLAIDNLIKALQPATIQEFTKDLDEGITDPERLIPYANRSALRLAPVRLLRAQTYPLRFGGSSWTQFQSDLKTITLPQLDSAIVRLESVLTAQDAPLVISGETDLQFDKGDFGMILSSAYLLKAAATVAASREGTLDLNGSASWIQTFDSMQPEDFASLSAENQEIVDHVSNLFSQNSSFNTVSETWKDAYAGIPTLVEKGIDAAIIGLNHGQTELEAGDQQRQDTYVVGQIDVDLTITQMNAIATSLEEVKNSWSTGTTNELPVPGLTLSTQFAKLFSGTQLDGHLPLYGLLPVEKWNQSSASDSIFSDSFDPDLISSLIYEQLGLSVSESNPHDIIRGQSASPSVSLYNIVTESDEPDTVGTISLDRAVNFCELQIGLVGAATQNLTIPGCKIVSGAGKYFTEARQATSGIFYFTNLEGESSWEPWTGGLKGFPELKDKIFFKDPTFGGALAGMSNKEFFKVFDVLNTSQEVPSTFAPPSKLGEIDYLSRLLEKYFLWLN